jgi:hypothetical protein
METITIQLPAPDFSFSDIAKEIAKEVCDDDLNSYGLMCLSNTDLDDYHKLDSRLRAKFYDLNTEEEQLVYISEILTFLTNLDIAEFNNKSRPAQNYKYFKKEITRAQYYFYKQANSIGYNFDGNTFNHEEVGGLNDKIDSILDSLETLKAGHEVLYNHIDELKKEFDSLKTDYILGKKKWYQRAAGVVATYSGTLVADSLFEPVKPLLHDLLASHASDFVQRLLDSK